MIDIEGVLVFGLIHSLTLALIVMGFSLTYGVSGVPNVAYGAFYILTGYIAWHLINTLGLPHPLAVLLAVIATGVAGAIMYWLVLQRIRGLRLAEIIATLGVGVAILEFLRWAGFVGFHYRLPVFMRGSLEIAGGFVDYQRLFIIGVGLVLVLFLWFFSRHTRVGLSFRAVAQNENTALCFGIKSDWTAMLGVAFGSAMAAIAAITILPLGIMTVETGYLVLTLVLAVAVVGGLGSIKGIIVASLIIGFSQIIAGVLLGPHWKMVVLAAAVVGVLAIKPSGSFGKFKELEERV